MISPLGSGILKPQQGMCLFLESNFARALLGRRIGRHTTCEWIMQLGTGKQLHCLSSNINLTYPYRYLYGGYGFGNHTAFDDIYILSLPSYKWVKGFPLKDGDNKYGHGGCTATVMNPNQMMVIGGWFPDPSASNCDSYLTQGQHGMYLGNNSGKADNAIWAKYDPMMNSYAVPDAVVSAIGGGYGPPLWLHLESSLISTQVDWRRDSHSTYEMGQS
jgi:hypothetical protein